MSNSIPALFKTSLIAAAVVSLSACSTLPNTEDAGLSRVGAGIMTAGRTTADVTGRAWDKTAYLLGFSDDDGERDKMAARSDEGLLMDAEDVALLEDSEAASRDTTIRPIVIRSATPNRKAQDQIPTFTQASKVSQPAASEALASDAASETPTNGDAVELARSDRLPQTEAPTEPAATLPSPAPVAEDILHKVTSSETLWDIAKSTTGDANNWHILADINNLGPNASVFPGQQLIIPADMIKSSFDGTAAPTPDEAAALEDTAPESAAENIYVDTQNLTGVTSVENPSAAAARIESGTAPSTDTVVADIEQSTQTTAKAFKLNPGETLWNFAKRTTGDATNWQAIAVQNDFSAEQAAVVRTGQTIYVPEALIKPELESAVVTPEPDLDTSANNPLSAPEEKEETVVEASTQPAPIQTAGTATPGEQLRTFTISSQSVNAVKETDVLLGGDDLLSEPKAAVPAIKIVEATFKAEETANRKTQTNEALKSASTGDQSPEQIMVSGTYYPKAIYNNADFSSSLLMRVSPGTTLQVAKAMGNWYQVKTSKGLGYVHQRDIK